MPATTVWRRREILSTFSTFRGFGHELGPLPGVAGFLALQQRAVLIDPDGREAVPGDAQRTGPLFSSRCQIGSAPCAGISYPVPSKSQEGHLHSIDRVWTTVRVRELRERLAI